MRLYQLPHWLRCLSFREPIFTNAMEFLLRRALTRRVHPTSQNSVAADLIGCEGVGNILRERSKRSLGR